MPRKPSKGEIKMSEKGKRLRARQFTYVQDLEHMKIKLDDINDLDSILLGSGCSEFAWIKTPIKRQARQFALIFM